MIRRWSHVLYQKAERNLLGYFDGALDLIHGLDALRPVGGGHIHGRRARAARLVSAHGEWTECEAAKPVRDAHMLLAIGIIQVLARAKISIVCAPPRAIRPAARCNRSFNKRVDIAFSMIDPADSCLT
jgi:hypothetical protein